MCQVSAVKDGMGNQDVPFRIAKIRDISGAASQGALGSHVSLCPRAPQVIVLGTVSSTSRNLDGSDAGV
jgi:hypothetical protein